MATTRHGLTALLAAVLFGTWSGAAAQDIATLVKTGDVAPGTGGAMFDGFQETALNGAGVAAFLARIANGSVTEDDDSGIWSGTPGDLVLVAREGDPAPGAAGADFGEFDSFVLNGAGDVAIVAGLAGSGVILDVNDAGLWLGKPGGLGLVARKGDPAPGAGGAAFSGEFNSVVLNGAGQAAFLVELSDGSESIWAGTAGSLVLVARGGDPAPGAGGADFGELGSVVLNGAGELAFNARLEGSGVTVDNRRGLWAGAPGSLALIARSGNPAPGAGGADFGFVGRPALNGAGELAFTAELSGSGVTPDNDDGLWASGPGGLAKVVRAGEAAPGAGGADFSDLAFPVLNGAGELAFKATLSDGGDSIWAGAPGDLELVARVNAAAPGTGGAVFTSLGSSFTLNGAGEVMFRGFLGGAGVTPGNDSGAWAGAPGEPRLVAREGAMIEVAPGDARTATQVFSSGRSGNEDGRRSAFNEGGQLSFVAFFEDLSEGIFLSPPETPTVHRVPNRAVDGAWDQVVLPRSFAKPVVIAGPPGLGDKQPGVVRLREIDGAKGLIEARFQEWRYLDGSHPEERADLLVLEKGRHVQADGSIWEAGRVRVKNNRTWKKKRFKPRFRSAPKVFVTVQSFKGRTPVAARVRNVTKKGFEVSIQEEEKDLAGKHPKETVGYLAVDSAGGGGTITGGVAGSDYRLKRTRLNHRFKTVLGHELKLEEERSQDKERRHKKEAVSALTLGRGFFAQQAGDKETDTTAIRRR